MRLVTTALGALRVPAIAARLPRSVGLHSQAQVPSAHLLVTLLVVEAVAAHGQPKPSVNSVVPVGALGALIVLQVLGTGDQIPRARA